MPTGYLSEEERDGDEDGSLGLTMQEEQCEILEPLKPPKIIGCCWNEDQGKARHFKKLKSFEAVLLTGTSFSAIPVLQSELLLTDF